MDIKGKMDSFQVEYPYVSSDSENKWIRRQFLIKMLETWGWLGIISEMICFVKVGQGSK